MADSQKPSEPNYDLFRIIQKEFKTHLLIPGNHRSIFSGKFGSGKSTFLDYFFSKEDAFRVITLHPVNYSIASNEDILNYIKHDLFMEILGFGNLDLNTYEFDFSQKLYLYLEDNIPEMAGQFLKIAAAVGKTVHPSFEIVEKIGTFFFELNKRVKEYFDQQSKKTDEARHLSEFLQSITDRPGSLYEANFLTQILEKAIDGLKSDGKKIVVVIEDLDRIDPDHIFRILNVFSAHFDGKPQTAGNSFGIDTLLAVCDEENIRNIFAARYGGNVDYNGYIDKFFSISVFNFSYSELLRGYTQKLISGLTFKDTEGRRPPDSIYNVVCTDGFLEQVLCALQDHRMIGIRALNRVMHTEIIAVDKNLKFDKIDVRLFNVRIVLELLIIAEVCGGITAAIECIKRLKHFREPFDKKGHVFERLVAVLMYNRHKFAEGTDVQMLIDNNTYKGKLSKTSDQDFYIQNLLVRTQSGEIGMDLVATDQYYSIIEKVFILINSIPQLRLNSYYYH